MAAADAQAMARTKAGKAEWGRDRGDSLYVSIQDAELYRRGQVVGYLPVGTVVSASLAGDGRWLRFTYGDREFDAKKADFQLESELLQDLDRREAEVREKKTAFMAEYKQLRDRLAALEEDAQRWESSSEKVTVVFPAPKPVANGDGESSATGGLVVETDHTGYRHAAYCRLQIERLNRRLKTLEPQLASLDREGLRLAEIRSSVERWLSNYRLARQQP